MNTIDDTNIAPSHGEGAQPIIERIRKLVGKPHASVTIVLDEGVWGFDEYEGNADYHAEVLTQAQLDWEGIEIGNRDSGIGWLHGPGVYVHEGDQVHQRDQHIDLSGGDGELQELLDMLQHPEVGP